MDSLQENTDTKKDDYRLRDALRVGAGLVLLAAIFFGLDLLTKQKPPSQKQTAILTNTLPQTTEKQSDSPWVLGPRKDDSPSDLDPLQVAGCETSAQVHYWDFTDPSSTVQRIQGEQKRNFYINCPPQGSSGTMSTYVFKNNELILKKESLYRGNAFMGYDNNFYTVEGLWGEANCCPRAYILTQYAYNHEMDVMEVILATEYPTYEIKTKDGYVTYYNKKLYDFEQEISIELPEDWGDFDWSSASSQIASVQAIEPICDNFKDVQTFEKPILIAWTAKLNGCLVSCWGASFTKVPENTEYPRFAGYFPYDSGGIPEQFLGDGLVLKVSGKWTGIDYDHPRTVFDNKCVPIIDIEKIEILR